MGNFADNILAEADGEKIESVVIGPFGWGYDLDDEEPYGMDDKQRVDRIHLGKPLSWRRVADLLDYEYTTSFGAPNCHAIWAWTASRVIFVSTYDGSTSVTSVPRNPRDGTPSMPGGG